MSLVSSQVCAGFGRQGPLWVVPHQLGIQETRYQDGMHKDIMVKAVSQGHSLPGEGEPPQAGHTVVSLSALLAARCDASCVLVLPAGGSF